MLSHFSNPFDSICLFLAILLQINLGVTLVTFPGNYILLDTLNFDILTKSLNSSFSKFLNWTYKTKLLSSTK